MGWWGCAFCHSSSTNKPWLLPPAASKPAQTLRRLSAELLEDAAPHYCSHHHSASVLLCCLLLVSLTAVSQAPACGRTHRKIMPSGYPNKCLRCPVAQRCHSAIDLFARSDRLALRAVFTEALDVSSARKLLSKCCILVHVIKKHLHKLCRDNNCCAGVPMTVEQNRLVVVASAAAAAACATTTRGPSSCTFCRLPHDWLLLISVTTFLMQCG